MSPSSLAAHKPWRDAAWCRREYVEKGRSSGEIAAECGVSRQAICSWLRKHGIERRGRPVARPRPLTLCADCGEPKPDPKSVRCAPCRDANASARWQSRRRLVQELWADGRSAAEIAAVMGWNPARASAILCNCRARGYDLPLRKPGASEANRGNAHNRYSKAAPPAARADDLEAA